MRTITTRRGADGASRPHAKHLARTTPRHGAALATWIARSDGVAIALIEHGSVVLASQAWRGISARNAAWVLEGGVPATLDEWAARVAETMRSGPVTHRTVELHPVAPREPEISLVVERSIDGVAVAHVPRVDDGRELFSATAADVRNVLACVLLRLEMIRQDGNATPPALDGIALGVRDALATLSRAVVSTRTTSSVDLGEAIRGAVDIVRPRLVVSGVDVEVVLEGVPRVVGEASEMRQLFVNLLASAMESSDRGTIRVEGSCDGGRVRVELGTEGLAQHFFHDLLVSPLAARSRRAAHDVAFASARRTVRKFGGSIRVDATRSTARLIVSFVRA